MTRSLRRTLAVRFAATMAVGLAGTSVAIWWAASRVLRHQVDQSVAALAFVAANELVRTSQCTDASHRMALDALRYRSQINRYIVFRDPQCRAIRAVPAWAIDLPVDSAALAAATTERPSFSEARWHDMTMRSAYVAVAGDSGETAGGMVVQVAASLDPVHVLQRIILLVLLGIVLLGFTMTFVGARRLSDSVVRPVAEITQQATHIEAGTLDQRIAAHASTEEYRGLVAVLNRMLERLEGAFLAQRRFTGDVSHELRTPLTALRGEIEVALRSDRSPREYQRVLNSALEEIDRLSTMTAELLLISRAEAHLITPERESTELAEVVQESLERMRSRIASKGLRVESTSTVHDSAAWVDRELIARLVGELLDNAVQYTEPGGRLMVRTERHADLVRLIVEDTGPGIAPADLPHLFEPHFRADEARTRVAGTGLGLTTALAIARLHGGSIRAANREGGGARFEVDLPTTAGAR